MKIYFLTFGAGATHEFNGAVDRICKQAESFNIFEKIYGFKDVDIINDETFWGEHSKFILSKLNASIWRGCGYWIWKAYLVEKVMKLVEHGDIVFYSDCGSELNIHGKDRFMEYIKFVEENDAMGFNLGVFLEKTYTKMDLFKYMNTSEEDINSGQIMSGAFFLKKTDDNLKMLNEFNELCKFNNYHFIDDSPSIEPNDETFIENRHDQSCFSILMKKYKNFCIPDETYFYPDWIKGIKYPIWALRNKTGNSIFK